MVVLTPDLTQLGPLPFDLLLDLGDIERVGNRLVIRLQVLFLFVSRPQLDPRVEDVLVKVALIHDRDRIFASFGIFLLEGC